MRLLRLVIACAILALAPLNLASAVEREYLVIGVDVSGSMRGDALKSTISAAEKIIRDLNSERVLELYVFTREPIKLGDVKYLETQTGGGYTALYDSIWTLTLRAAELSAPLIILTDGQDSRSSLSENELTELLSGVLVNINFISYNPLPEDRAVLDEIARLTGGKSVGVTESVKLIEALTQVVAEVDIKQNSPSRTVPVLIATVVSVIALTGLQLITGWRRREGRIDKWTEILDQYEVKSTPDQAPRNANAPTFITKLFGDTSMIAPGIKGNVEREAIFFASVIALSGVLVWFRLPLILALTLSLLSASISLRLLAERARRKLRRHFENELPSSLRLIASSLAAGLSFLQALDSFSADGNSQVAREFRRALSEIQMGSPVEKALGDVADRMQSEDLKWVVFAFSIQREVGGGLAKILQTSAETIDNRSSLRQEIRTLSTEGRISSYILMLLPPGIFLFLLATKREFISLFWVESIGQGLLVLVIMLMGLAWIWIRRLVNLAA
ncbi:MAG: hypothetical protein EB112_02200 [Actinobacteria bacterium]|nr:hypothetical protein [Actinomycetota bacterium]